MIVGRAERRVFRDPHESVEHREPALLKHRVADADPEELDAVRVGVIPVKADVVDLSCRALCSEGPKNLKRPP